MVAARCETKYLVQPELRTALRCDLELLLDHDLHADAVTNGYEVATLYFDTPARRNYTDKLDGVPLRRKFRIRQYGNDAATRRFELKERIFDRHRKQRTMLSNEDYKALVSGRLPQSRDPIVLAYWAERARQALQPCLVVQYSRLAFVGRADRSVRVTFDTSLRARRATRFEDTRSTSVPALSPGMTILEFKWTTAFPFWMQALVQKYSLRNAAISKYCLGTEALMARGLAARV